MAEAFICRIFKVAYDSCDNGHVHLFYNANHQRHCPLQVMQFNLIFKEQIIKHSFGNKLMCLFLQCHRLPHLVGRAVTESSSLFSPLFHLFQRHAEKYFSVDVQRAAPAKTVHAKRQEIYHVLLLASVLIDRCPPTQTKSNPPKLMFVLQ